MVPHQQLPVKSCSVTRGPRMIALTMPPRAPVVWTTSPARGERIRRRLDERHRDLSGEAKTRAARYRGSRAARTSSELLALRADFLAALGRLSAFEAASLTLAGCRYELQIRAGEPHAGRVPLRAADPRLRRRPLARLLRSLAAARPARRGAAVRGRAWCRAHGLLRRAARPSRGPGRRAHDRGSQRQALPAAARRVAAGGVTPVH